jgi:hypothetical protein
MTRRTTPSWRCCCTTCLMPASSPPPAASGKAFSSGVRKGNSQKREGKCRVERGPHARTHTYARPHTHIPHTHSHTHTHTHTHTRTHARTHARTHTHTRGHIHMQTDTHTEQTHTHAHTCMYRTTRAHVQARMRTTGHTGPHRVRGGEGEKVEGISPLLSADTFMCHCILRAREECFQNVFVQWYTSLSISLSVSSSLAHSLSSCGAVLACVHMRTRAGVCLPV